MQFRGPGTPPLGIVYDSDMASIDRVLALAMLYGLQGKGEARLISVSVSRPSLNAAALCDALAQFYLGPPGGFFVHPAVGMAAYGRPGDDIPIPLEKYPHSVQKLNDTADPVALIRNALTAQVDQNAVVVMAGPSTNLAGLMALPEAKELIAQKVKLLVTVGKPGLAWPAPTIEAPVELGDELPFPGACIETDLAYAPAHPVADAYRAYKPMPYDAPGAALAAVLYAARAKENYFKVSGGKLAADAEQKERVIAAYKELVSARPVPRVRPQRKKQE